MASTTAAVLFAAGRRISRSSASTIVWREVRGQHKLTIDGCIPSTKLPRDWSATSRAFEAGGYSWQITYEPYGYGNSWRDKYISVELVYGGKDKTDPLEFAFSLLDHAGEPVPRFSRRSPEICCFDGEHRRRQGFEDFVRWKDLEESGCLRDNRFAIQCDITVIKDWALDSVGGGLNGAAAAAVPPPARVVAPPPPDLREHLGGLLRRKRGTDVSIDVAGEATFESFDAHGWLLAARSPAFEAAMVAGDDGGRRRMEIRGIEPRVFEAMLHFVYTDSLPEMKERELTAMVQGLLAAAQRYKMERLKLVCEEMLCKHIDVDNVASTLVSAERNGCLALKEACMEFIAIPGNLNALMETEGYEKMKANCPNVFIEFLMKKWPE